MKIMFLCWLACYPARERVGAFHARLNSAQNVEICGICENLEIRFI